MQLKLKIVLHLLAKKKHLMRSSSIPVFSRYHSNLEKQKEKNPAETQKRLEKFKFKSRKSLSFLLSLIPPPQKKNLLKEISL